jgi:hypothetical protein
MAKPATITSFIGCSSFYRTNLSRLMCQCTIGTISGRSTDQAYRR